MGWILCAFGFLLSWQAAPPPSTAVEKAATAELAKIGGVLQWVRAEDGWEFSLDVDNRLAALRVFQGRLDERSLTRLASLQSLNLLVLLSEGLTDEGMARIGRLKGLTKLDVKGPRISRKGLSALGSLTRLRRLYLYNTQVHDADLEPLAGMRALEVLDLPKTVTDRGLARLRAALPTTKIERI